MTEKEFFIETMKNEVPIFERLFKALPVDKLHHTHHPKSKTAGALAIQMAEEAESIEEFLTTGLVDWGIHKDMEPDMEKVAAVFSTGLSNAASLAEKMTDEEWASEARALHNGAEVWKTTKGKMAWGLLFDLVHHRGQLSTYIRPMGGRVPSIYGPSGDDMGA
ncbi:MAG: DinB family protein [Parcubacteria group bacterium]|nr:DinB family protein [Parcubacteria group bacterium]